MGHFSFIIGDAGSGKSTFIYETLTGRTLEEPGRPFYLVVPEQNTLKAQQELIRRSPVHGMLSLDVISFTRLSYRVLEELDEPAPDVLDEVSKSVLLRKALKNVKNRLSVYKNKTESQGFVSQLKSALSEFGQYGVTEEDLRKASLTASTPLLQAKCKDLELIFTEFQSLLSGGGESHVIPEEVPELLLKNLEKSKLLDGAVLYFDGFTGFTPLQLSIIERMAQKADELVFAVTIPEEEFRKEKGHFTDLFWFSRENVKKVTDACTRAGILQGETVVLSGRRGKDRHVSDRLTVPGDVETVLAGFAGPVEEVRFAAAKIREKAVLENGRYRRMAVAVSELSSYKEIIRREFASLGIPFFIDDRSDSAGSPVVELIRSALLSATEGYAYEDVCTYLKNPYVSGEDRDSLDRTENYVRAMGIRGRTKWEEDWSSKKSIPARFVRDIAGLNAWKEEHLRPVFRLHDGLKAEKTCAGKADRVLKFLEESEFPEELSADDRRFLDLSEELFSRLSSLFREEEMGMREFAELAEAGFSEMKAGMIPAGMDFVSVGDLKRSRFDDIDDLFLLGANEGKIPQTVSGGGIFTDRERMELAGGELELAPDDRHDAVIQNFYLYLLLHKPVRSLTVSFSATGRDGARQSPSQILAGGKITFPETGPTSYGGLLCEFTEDLGEETEKVTEQKAERMRRDWALLNENEETAGKAEACLAASGICYRESALPKEVAGLLYGKKITGSVTRLETFEKCPYRYFLEYGLRLKERETYDVEAVDVGSLYHGVLDSVIRELEKKGKNLGNVSPEELEEMTGKMTAEAVEGFRGGVFAETARNRYISAQIARITKKTLEKLSEQFRAGEFQTLETEHPFRLDVGTMELAGRIDRIDTLEKEGKTYVKVIDYKSGRKEFDLGLCYEGIEMQLAAYLYAALKEQEKKGKKAVPAGMFLYHIKDPVRKAGEETGNTFQMDGVCIDDLEVLKKMDRALEEGEDSEIVPVKLTSKGLSAYSDTLDEESFRLLLERSVSTMQRDAGRIMAGEIGVCPAGGPKVNGCDYCSMQPVCGFDRRIPGYDYRYVQSQNKSTVTEKLREESE